MIKRRSQDVVLCYDIQETDEGDRVFLFLSTTETDQEDNDQPDYFFTTHGYLSGMYCIAFPQGLQL
jgi:hypothetical protein